MLEKERGEVMLFWLVICGIALLLELLTPGALVSIWFVVGALGAMLFALLQVSFYAQVIVFVVLSIASMLLVRPIATRYLHGRIIPTNFDRMVGKTAIVIEDITSEHWGQVKIQGGIWHAISKDDNEIKKGEKVQVVTIEGVKLIVQKIDME